MLVGGGNGSLAQTAFESPALSDPSLLAAIFAPTSRKPAATDQPVVSEKSPFGRVQREFRQPARRRIPENWEAFEKQFAPEAHPDQPHLQLLENGLYTVNQTIYSIKLFERNINSLLNLEYSLNELRGYDARSKANELDNFFDHAKLKTEFDWDAPIGLYVGVKFQIKCDSIFQFWK
jgi:hypothetical protein